MVTEVILTREQRLKITKKINHVEALGLHAMGLSDGKIAKKFLMSRSAVFTWRKKHGIIANNLRTHGGKNKTSIELQEKYKKDCMKIVKLNTNRYKENREEISEYTRRRVQIPRVRKKILAYHRINNATESRKKQKREWNKNHKESIKKYNQKYFQDNKKYTLFEKQEGEKDE